VADIQIFNNGDSTVAVYRKSVMILPGLVTEIIFAPKEATEEEPGDFLDPAAAAAVVALGTDPFGKAEDDESISEIDFTPGNPAILAVTAVSEAETARFTLTKTGEQVVEVGGEAFKNGDVILVSESGEPGDSTDTLAVFVVKNLGQGKKEFAITVAEEGMAGVTVNVTVTREAAGLGFGLYSKALSAPESDYTKVAITGTTLDDILKYLAVDSNITDNTSYLALIDSDQEIAPWASVVNAEKTGVEITLRGIGMEQEGDGEKNWEIKWDKQNSIPTDQTYGLLTVNAGTSLVLDGGITLDGDNTVMPINSNQGQVAMVWVNGGNNVACLTMQGKSKIVRTKSPTTGVSNWAGSAVNVQGANSKFVMNDGEISDNESRLAIVWIGSSAHFVMNDGAIIRNTLNANAAGSLAMGVGAAVWCGGNFDLNGGEISHNTKRGVTVGGKVFTMTGGSIIGNGTTATYPNGQDIAGAGLYLFNTSGAMTGGEISGNGKNTSLGNAIYFSTSKFVLAGKVSIKGSVVVYSGSYILLDNKFTNTYYNDDEKYVIPICLRGNQGNFDNNWAVGKAVLKHNDSNTAITDVFSGQFKLQNGVTGSDGGFTNVDITNLILKEDGTVGTKTE
jgi:hypothetical protein